MAQPQKVQYKQAFSITIIFFVIAIVVIVINVININKLETRWLIPKANKSLHWVEIMVSGLNLMLFLDIYKELRFLLAKELIAFL